MPEWLVSIIVAACVIFITFGATFAIAVLMSWNDLVEGWRQHRHAREWKDSQ